MAFGQPRSGRKASQTMLLHGTQRRSQLSNCLASAADFHLSDDDALSIFKEQISLINSNWDETCKEAQLNEVDRKLFWRRQFLNELAFEGLENELKEQIAGRMRLEKTARRKPIETVCHETIYRFAYSKDGQEIKLWQHLPERRVRRRPRHARRRHGQTLWTRSQYLTQT